MRSQHSNTSADLYHPMHSEGAPVFLLQLQILVLSSDNVILHHNTGIFHPPVETNN